MSQYPGSFGDQTNDPFGMPKKTSGLAVTGLVMSLIGIIPICGAISAPIGAVLGLIGTITIKPTSEVKGKGLALAAFVIGLILTAAQIGGGIWVFNTFFAPVAKGPDPALRAGFAGDIAGFKAAMYGPAASAPDAQAQAFIDQLRARYGEYQSFEMRGGQQGQQQFGQPTGVFPYQLTFTNGTVMCETEITFADQQQGGFVMKPSQITIIDSEAGNLSYPGAAPAPAPRTPVPGDTTSTTTDTPPSEPPDPSRP